jgi:hypothetical protein
LKKLELGSGLSTLLFANHAVQHTAIENDSHIMDSLLGMMEPSAFKEGWYDWQPTERHDLILNDRPNLERNRKGVF